MTNFLKIDSYRTIEDATNLYNQRIKDSLDIYYKYHNEFIARKCYICGSGESTNVDKYRDSYNIVKCSVCGNIFVNPAPNMEALNDYYENYNSNTMLDKFYKKRDKRKDDFVINDRISIVLNLIKEIDKSEINILEIGCGSGLFLSKLRIILNEVKVDKKINFIGIDIDRNAINSNLDNKLNLICSSVEEFTKVNRNKYDIVLNFELIEHLLDPYEFMIQIYNNLLNDNSYMFFTVPNYNSLDNKGLGYNSFRLLAHSIFPPMHINSFSNENILHFAIRSGFNIVEIKSQGKLDVDLLSKSCNLLNDDELKKVSHMNDETMSVLQYILNLVNGTGNLRCILKKK